MAVIVQNVWLYHYDENGKRNVGFHVSLSGYELAYKEEGPFPNYYRIWAQEGGSVSDITIGPGGEMTIDAGAQCSDVTVLSAVGNIQSPLLEISGIAENVVASSIVRVEAGGVLNGVTVLEGGKTNAYNGSAITNGEICKGGNLTLFLASVGQNITVASGGYLGVQYDSTVVNVTVNAEGTVSTLYESTIDTMTVAKGANCRLGDKTKLKGTIALAEAPVLLGEVDASGAEVVFALQTRTTEDGAIISDWEKCAFGAVSISLSSSQEYGLYKLAGNAAAYDFSAELYVADEKLGELTTSNALGQGDDVYYMGYAADWSLAFVKDECSYVLLSLDESLGNYTVSKTFAKELSVYVDKNATLLVAGRKASEKEWGDDVYCDVNEIKAGSQLVQTVDDRVADVILPVASGVWDFSFCAFNAEIGEYRGMAGKNRYDDVVWSGSDAALVMLTDSDDALFADDIFTDMPNDVNETDARLKAITEIRAGAGDDLIDLSMEHADDANQNVILRGGDGNDILWGGNDGARLLGDSGNDELVGGAGNDLLAGGAGDDLLIGLGGQNIYAFGHASGCDVVELNPEEDFVFWFDDGINPSIIYNYDKGTAMIALDDGSSISVMGLTADNLSEKMLFGKADGAMFAGCNYDYLKELGVFDADSSARCFNTLAGK
ncbi:MAG: hypothetical protein MJ106_00520 [Lentisphaeria bacterium]|nr:hypothetical protein [Lentisphaeria bacterium]